MNTSDNNSGNYDWAAMSGREYAKRHGLMVGGIADAYQFYYQFVAPLPMHVILPTTPMIRKLISIFGPESEILLHRIVVAISDRCSADLKIAKAAGEIYKSLGERKLNRNAMMMEHHGVAFMDHMVTFEQAGLDLRDVIKNNGLYVEGRWLPYAYEATVNGFDVMLKRPSSFEEFCDDYLWASGIDEYLQP